MLAAKPKGLNLTLGTQMAERSNFFKLFSALRMHAMPHTTCIHVYLRVHTHHIIVKRNVGDHSRCAPIPPPKGRGLEQGILGDKESFLFNRKLWGRPPPNTHVGDGKN